MNYEKKYHKKHLSKDTRKCDLQFLLSSNLEYTEKTTIIITYKNTGKLMCFKTQKYVFWQTVKANTVLMYCNNISSLAKVIKKLRK